MHAMGALLWVLGYGVAVACVGLVLAVQERRKHRTSEQKVNEVFEALQHAKHARLTTDTGQELEVFLAAKRAAR